MPDLIVKGGATYRAISDHLGTPRLIVDQASGGVVERLDLDEWGNVLDDTNVGWQPFGFDGGLADPATGLVRFGARDLDPRSGRWTSKDASGIAGGLNFYAFAANEPVNHADPNGLDVVAYGAGAQDALDLVAADPVFGPLLQDLNADPNVDLQIVEGSAAGSGGGRTLEWTTFTGVAVGGCKVTNGRDVYHGVIIIDPQLAWNTYNLTEDRALSHELAHFERFYDNIPIDLPATWYVSDGASDSNRLVAAA